MPSRRWIRHAFRAKAIQVRLILAPQFYIFNATATAQRVVSENRNMVRFVKGSMSLQQVQTLIDSLWEVEFPNQLMHYGDSNIRGAHMTRPHLNLYIRAL